MAKVRGWVAGLASLAFAGVAMAQDGLPEGLRWGWTQQQLLAASPDIRPSRHGGAFNDARPRAEGPIRIGDQDLRARYYFDDDDSLKFVKVEVPYQRCRDALTALVNQYGEPLIVSDQTILKNLIWHDTPHQARPVLMVSQAGICSLTLFELGGYRDHDLAEVAAGHARPPT